MTDDTSQKIRNWVAAGLGLSQKGLKSLVTAYGKNTLELSVPVLSSLYRNALLSRFLNMEMGTYLTFMNLLGLDIQSPLPVDKLVFLLERKQLLQLSKVTAIELEYLTDSSKTLNSAFPFTTKELEKWFAMAKSLLLNVTGSTEDQKVIVAKYRKLLGMLATLFKVN